MTEIKEAATADTSDRPFDMQERYYNTHLAGARQAVNDNEALSFAEQKARDIAYSEKFIPDDIDALKRFFGATASVEVVKDETRQFAGIDYIVRYTEPRTGAILTARIDAKRRKAGVCMFWRDKGIPELTFEIRNNGGKFVSCLTDPNERTDFYLFTFEDTGDVYLIPFQIARLVLSQPSKVTRWRAVANSNGSGAECVYIPVDEFFTAAFMTGHLPAWLLQRLSVNLAEAAALKTLQEANDNVSGERKAAGIW
ncbi:MAG: hypothetical protein IJ752_01735 [Alphaproteobacteria bacterium]|nr:hypothetical protein [Alphaproteobacteria bacterium]